MVRDTATANSPVELLDDESSENLEIFTESDDNETSAATGGAGAAIPPLAAGRGFDIPIAFLVDLEISIREAIALLGLFALLFLPYFQGYEGLLVFSVGYLLLGIVVLVRRRQQIPTVIEQAIEHGRRKRNDGHASPPTGGE